MTDQDYIAEHAAQCDADEREFHEAGLRALAADHAAEVKRLTAERDEARAACKREHNYYVAARSAFEREIPKAAALTARVAELESGSAFVGEEYREGASVNGICWIQDNNGLQLTHALRLDVSVMPARVFRYTGPTTASIPSPLPTAGDEACEVNPIVSRMCERGTKCCTVEHAPAEPDSGAEERPSKLRDESWVREAADAEDQHASVCAGDMAPRKPACLDGVPAVLCEWDAPAAVRRGEPQVWAFGPVVRGIVAYCEFNSHAALAIGNCNHKLLTPIHHDPTDAAAVELAGRIAEGGGG